MSRHHIKIGDTKIFIDSKTLMVNYKMPVEIVVAADSQHDGHPWHKASILEYEEELLEKIMIELRPLVKKHIVDSGLWSVHIFKDSP